MAAQSQGGAAPNADLFDAYFRRADLDRDGRISGAEAVAFFQGSNLPKPVLAQIWTYADKNRQGYLSRAEFYNALKLVTVAQSRRELTPDIVQAAIYGPASAKIPAPQITSTASPVQSNLMGVNVPAPQIGSVSTSHQNPGFRGLSPSSPNVNMAQQYNAPQVHVSSMSLHTVSGAAARPVHTVGVQGAPGGGSAVSPSSGMPNVQMPQATFSDRGIGASALQAGSGYGAPASVTSLPSRSPAPSGVMQSSSPVVDPKFSVSGNGLASDSLFGSNAFSAVSHPKKDNSGAIQSPPQQGSVDMLQNSRTVQPAGGQLQKMQSLPEQNQQVSVPNTSIAGQLQRAQSLPEQNIQAAVENMSTAPRVLPQGSVVKSAQMQWPKMTQSDIQKYTKVFLEVDTDRDGKITGVQARNLFLSWRLPREVLKQVWDLSDQDNDSMLSLREFCIALYLMERYREGRSLPAVLPSDIAVDLPKSIPSSAGTAAFGFSPGYPQQAMPVSNVRQIPRPAGRPPLPVPSTMSDDRPHPKQQKAKVPVLEKPLVDQLSEEEQKSLNSRFQEATEANKKVEELDKEIKEAREKIEYYRAKMQELVLYKSRCDNRLNEIIERTAADKREVESLAKKYEEKYRQAGDVASKLTIEEATFRDIQERKMELYRAIVNMEQEGSADDSRQVRADRIQSNLEELVKSLNERCKTYGLRGKPTTLLELPFGWQPGIEEEAADWDEDWDKFEDEGFTLVKELTLDVQNVIAPPKVKDKTAKKEKGSEAEGLNATASSDADAKEQNASSVVEEASGETNTEKPAPAVERGAENGLANDQPEDFRTESPSHGAVDRGSDKNLRAEVPDNQVEKMVKSDASPRATESQSGHRGADSSSSGDKTSAWGTFDADDDVDSVWGSKGFDLQKDDLFGPGGFSLNPIKTGSAYADNDFQRKSQSIFADSVPSTPYIESNVQQHAPSVFADSVPSTPFTNNSFQRRGPSVFADSVPSTPLHGSSYSPRRKSEGLEETGFNFSRFDSFRSTESGFQPQETVSRFDSTRSTGDFDYGNRFPSFDDSDPFGSVPFASTFGSDTPKRGTDSFGSSEPFRSLFGSETPRRDDHAGSLGSFRPSFDSETPRADYDSSSYGRPFNSAFGSETPRTEDPFGGPFRSSLGSETPRSDFDPFGSSGPFRSSLGSETPRTDSDAVAPSGPFKSSFTNETSRGGTSNWSAF